MQANQHVRHADVREHLVVHAIRTRLVLVEAAQVGVQPVSTTHPGDQGQVRRRGAEPGLGIVRPHADLHVIANLGTREHQVLEHQLVGNTQVVGNTLVTLELGAVATHAIVGKGACAVLHGSLVGQIDINLVQYHAGFGREGQRGHHCQNQYCK
ncbi:hypothetical protein D3C84_939020 [compost metagenome]